MESEVRVRGIDSAAALDQAMRIPRSTKTPTREHDTPDAATVVIDFDVLLAHDLELLQGIRVLGIPDVPNVLVNLQCVNALSPSLGHNRRLRGEARAQSRPGRHPVPIMRSISKSLDDNSILIRTRLRSSRRSCTTGVGLMRSPMQDHAASGRYPTVCCRQKYPTLTDSELSIVTFAVSK